MRTYSRASSSASGVERRNSASRVRWPHECERLRVTSRAPHLGQIARGRIATYFRYQSVNLELVPP
jgi:hypothetical protein